MRNPDAADTLEGIARWRLIEEAIHRTTEETAQAVDWLESRGYLKRVPTVGSAQLFVLDQTRATEAAEFLSKTKPNGGSAPQER